MAPRFDPSPVLVTSIVLLLVGAACSHPIPEPRRGEPQEAAAVVTPPAVVPSAPTRELAPESPSTEELRRWDALVAAIAASGVDAAPRALKRAEHDAIVRAIAAGTEGCNRRAEDGRSSTDPVQKLRIEAFVLEKRATLDQQRQALAAGRYFVIGKSGTVHELLTNHYSLTMPDWANVTCGLPDGEEFIFLLPNWSGTAMRDASDQADAIRAQAAALKDRHR